MFSQCVVFLLFILHFKHTKAFQQPGLDLGGRRTRREVHCKDNLEYLNGNICCLECPAGTRLISHCTVAGRKGKCEECNDGTFTEHTNTLKQCLPCTRCRPDQEVARACTHTHDAECRCKSGGFCAPDQPCEVCKMCSRCGKDEEIARNCTSTANAECKKIQPKSDPASDKAAVIVPLLLIGAAVFVGLVVLAVFLWRRYRAADSHGNPPDGLKAGQEDEQFLKLVPVKGEESLRKCFEYFGDLHIDYHKRFFRRLGLRDNVIDSKQSLEYEDRIHDLLNIWVEKEGSEASLNDLLKALLAFNQRRTAETIKEKALEHGHYTQESE